MAIRLSTGMSHASLNGSLNGTGVSAFDSGIVDVYTGSQPASADDAPTGTLVVSWTLPADAFANAAARASALNGVPITDPSADGTGIAGWFRIRSASDSGALSTTDRRIDGSCGETADSPDMVFDNKDINAGQEVDLESLSLGQPANA